VLRHPWRKKKSGSIPGLKNKEANKSINPFEQK